MGSFVSCIKMDAYAYNHGIEREMILALYFQVLQTVVVRDTVDDAFTIYSFVFFGILWNMSMETKYAIVLNVNGTSI